MPSVKQRDTYLIPFPITEPLTFTDTPVALSKTSLYVPGFLIDYYNRRALVGVAAELRNAEVQLVPIDEAGNPLEGVGVVYLGSPDADTIYRLTSEQAEISQFLRTAQDLVFTVYGRMVADDASFDAEHKAVLRHVTLVLLLGELPP